MSIWEINFSVTRKVLDNNEDLELRVFTNDKLLPTEVFMIGIFIKEQYKYLEQR